MAKLTFTGATREADAESARAAAVLAGDPAHVHVIPAEKIIRVYTGTDVVTFDPRPTVTKWQLVQACADAGITEAQLDSRCAAGRWGQADQLKPIGALLEILQTQKPIENILV